MVSKALQQVLGLSKAPESGQVQNGRRTQTPEPLSNPSGEPVWLRDERKL